MKKLTAREKNLGVMVLVVCLLAAWWYEGRILEKKMAEVQAGIDSAQDQIRNMNASVATLRAATDGPLGAGSPATGPKIAQSKLTMTLLQDLTLPPESENIRVVSVTRLENSGFSMQVEGGFAEMMKFLSYLERMDSRFSVGNVQLGKAAETPDASGKLPIQRIRGSIQIAMKG